MSTLAQPIPQVTGLAVVQASRLLPCSVCYAAAGVPCRGAPDRDHLARYCDAEANGSITRPQLAVVIEHLIVISTRVLVDAAGTAAVAA